MVCTIDIIYYWTTAVVTLLSDENIGILILGFVV